MVGARGFELPTSQSQTIRQSVVSSGSGLSDEQATQLETAVAESTAARKVFENNAVTSADNSTSTIFDDDVTEMVDPVIEIEMETDILRSRSLMKQWGWR